MYTLGNYPILWAMIICETMLVCLVDVDILVSWKDH